MQTQDKSYEVTIIKKVPYLTEFLFFLLLPGILVLLMTYVFLLPSALSSNEMQVVALFKLIPDNLQFILLYFGLSTIILYPLYKFVKIYKTARLTFNDQFLLIHGKYLDLKIPVNKISKIYFKDPINYRGESKEKLIIYILEKSMRTTTLKLKDYSSSEDLFNDFTEIENLRPLLAESNATVYVESED
jgi:hypothetical protein